MGNSVFSFMNPVADFSKEDYKTMNNEVLISALTQIGVNAEASGRNDLHVEGRKVSGSAYKLSLGRKDGSGRKSLHHGTMLLDLDLTALGKYLNPSKLKLQSKGVDSVVSRVMNLKEKVPHINHSLFSEKLAHAFANKWQGRTIKERVLKISDLEKVPKLMQIYEDTQKWEWRFGHTPEFSNQIEKKFSWALMDF